MWNSPLLGLLLAAEELHVVHQQHVGAAVALAEVGGFALADGGHEIRHEAIAADVERLQPALACPVADGVQQVRLSQPRGRVEEDGVVLFARKLRRSLRRRHCELVRRADGEPSEDVTRVERELRYARPDDPRRRQRLGCFDVVGARGASRPRRRHRVRRLHLETHVHRSARHALEGPLHYALHALAEVLGGEGARRGDHEAVVGYGDTHGLLEEGIIAWSGHLHLQVAEHSFP